jgi:2-polyprenyl-3-methyl-5-hydroxy-6-metoxy-1,4-benzoquinol methylase
LAEFDSYAPNYKDLVSESVRITGESSDYFAAYKAAYIARRVSVRPGGKALDYGCGIGLLSKHLKRCLGGVRIDGFDPSHDSLAQIDESLRQQGAFRSNLKELGQDYDLVVLANVLHHVKPAERLGLVKEAASRLAAGGRIVVIEHNGVNPLTRHAVAQCPFDVNAVLLPTRETRDCLRKSGLSAVRLEYIVFFPRWLSWLRKLEPSLAWCPLGAQYAMVAQRLLNS